MKKMTKAFAIVRGFVQSASKLRNNLGKAAVLSSRFTSSAAVGRASSSGQDSDFAKIRYLMQFDGGSRGNPGVSGAGAVIFEVDPTFSSNGNHTAGVDASVGRTISSPDRKNSKYLREIWHGCVYLGVDATNNQAEYAGLIEGLRKGIDIGIAAQCSKSASAAASIGTERVRMHIEGDSELVLRQVQGEYKVKNVSLQASYAEVRRLLAFYAPAAAPAAAPTAVKSVTAKAVDVGCGAPSRLEQALWAEKEEAAAAAAATVAAKADNAKRALPAILRGHLAHEVGAAGLVTFGHIARDLNSRADALSNEAMDSRQSRCSSSTGSVQMAK